MRSLARLARLSRLVRLAALGSLLPLAVLALGAGCSKKKKELTPSEQNQLARPGEPAAAPDPAAGSAAHPGAAHPGAGHHGMHKEFKNAEQWAKVFDDPKRDEWQRPDEVVALLELEPNLTVADVGAGTGYFVGRLSKAVGPAGFVIATDVEADMIRYLEQRAAKEGWPNVRAAQVAFDDPGLPAGSVDRILIVDVWHHVSDRLAYAKKLAAALRPGGLIAVVDFEKAAKQGPPPEHRLEPKTISDELAAAGLTTSLATEQLPDQYVVIARAAQ